MQQSNPNARRVLAVGCACGLLGSLTLPWNTVSCVLFALASALLAAGCLMLRAAGAGYGRAAKPAVVAVVAFLLGIVLNGGSLFQMPVVLGVALLYFVVAYYADAVMEETETKVSRSGAPRPPKAAMRFEYAAGFFILALLVGDIFAVIMRPAQVVAMIAMGVGFVQLGLYAVNGPRKEDKDE